MQFIGKAVWGRFLRVGVLIVALGAPRPLRAQGDCSVEWVPTELPPLSAVLDSVALMESPLVEAIGHEVGTVLLTLRFARQVAGRRVDVVGTDIALPTAMAIRSFVESIMAEETPVEAWGVRLRIVLRKEVTVSLEEAGYCSPQPEREVRFSTRDIYMFSEDDVRDVARGGMVRVKVEVDVFGNVLNAELLRHSGSRLQNELVLEMAWDREYLPALLDGVPVQSTYEYQISWRSRNR